MTADLFDLSRARRIHVVGAGGPGMSAIAIVLAQMGHRVSASDRRETAVLDRLREVGVEVSIGHRAEVVAGCDAVTWSPAVPIDNVERASAARFGARALDRAEALAAVCARARSIGVAGTHGKTTTSSLIRCLLDASGEPTSFVIGGDLLDLGTGARWTGSEYLVVEADESDGTHERLPLEAGIVTNIDVDHLDHFGSFDEIIESFVRFLRSLPGPRIVDVDDSVSRSILGRLPEVGTVTYGSQPDADWRWTNVEATGERMSFDLTGPDRVVRRVDLPLRGEHNVSNCAGAVAIVAALGRDVDMALRGLSGFRGVGRRFEIVGRDGGATFVDDYAHLPGEISAVLRAARASGEWDRIVAVFQPNRFHRVAAMANEYGTCFGDADEVVVMDVYASGTERIAGVTGDAVAAAVRSADPGRNVRFVAERAEVISLLADSVGAGTLCISMGCGDVEDLPREVLAARRGGNP